MIDDLYSSRLAMSDFGCLLASLAVLVAAGWLALPTIAVALGGTLGLAGGAVFVTNMLLVVHEHSPHSLGTVITGLGDASDSGSAEPPEGG